ncbi:MAG: hypothetical protein ACXW2G_09360 [Burkholderiaceae bacterium]
MKRHHCGAPVSNKRSGTDSCHVVAAGAFLAAGLSFAVFITLFRAPMPADAFAALGQQIATTRGSVAS